MNGGLSSSPSKALCKLLSCSCDDSSASWTFRTLGMLAILLLLLIGRSTTSCLLPFDPKQIHRFLLRIVIFGFDLEFGLAEVVLLALMPRCDWNILRGCIAMLPAQTNQQAQANTSPCRT